MKQVTIAAVLLLILPVALCVQTEEWRLVASEIDSETLSANASQVIWSQTYARAREMTTYTDPRTGRLHILFNGGGSTSIYDLDKSTGSMKILVDGSSSSKRSLGRMVSVPEKDLLLVVDVSRFQILAFSLSNGTFLDAMQPFEGHGCRDNIGGLTYITPSLSPDTDAIAWNEGSGCVLEITVPGTVRRLMDERTQVTHGLADIVEYPAELLHLLYEDCSVQTFYGSSERSPRTTLGSSLDQQTCNQMTVHLASLSYLITSPTLQSVAVVNITTKNVVNTVSGPDNTEPYSIVTAAWNEDLVLIGAGISVYGINAKRLIDSSLKRSASLMIWSDVLPAGEYPIPDLSRIYQQPDALGGGLYFISSNQGFLLRPVASNSGNNKYHLVRADSMAATFDSLDALGYFPNQKCPQRAIGVTQSMVKTYISGISLDQETSMLMEYTGGGSPAAGRLLYKSYGRVQRISAIDHHPFHPLLALGTSDGHVLFIDTNTRNVLKDLSYGSKSYISSVSWVCSSSSSLELYVTDRNGGMVKSYTFAYRREGDPSLTAGDSFGPFHQPRNLVQNPVNNTYYVVCEEPAGGFEAYVIRNKTFSRANFSFRFSNLVFQKTSAVTPTLDSPVMRPSSGPGLDRALFVATPLPDVYHQSLGVPPTLPPSQISTESSTSEPTVHEESSTESVVPLDTSLDQETFAPSEQPQNQEQQQDTVQPDTPQPSGQDQVTDQPTESPSQLEESSESEEFRAEVSPPSPSAQAPATESRAKREDSVKTPVTVVLALVAGTLVLSLAILAAKRIQEYRHRKDWDSKRKQPLIAPTTEGELTRWAFAQQFNDRAGRKTSSGPVDALQNISILDRDVDEEQRAASMSRMPDDSPTEKLARMLKLAGVGVQSLVSRVIPPRTASRPFYSMVEPAPDPTGIDIGYSPGTGDPKRLKVYQVNVKNEHGVTFMRQTSSGTSSPAPAATPPRQHSPRRVMSMQTAAANYSAASERSSSAWPDGATVVVNAKTHKLEEEIDLNSSSDDDDVIMKRVRDRSAGQDRSLGDKVSGVFKDLFDRMPFRAATSQKQK